MQSFKSNKLTMLFVLTCFLLSCYITSLKTETISTTNLNLSPISSLENNNNNLEIESLIQLNKLEKIKLSKKLHKEKKEKLKTSNSLTNELEISSTYKKINQNQAFESACKSARVISNRYLEATCNGKRSRLDLNKCLYAEEGTLVYDPEGEFYDSCSKCRINYPRWNGKQYPVNFECKCYDEDLREIKTNINLKDFAYYDNGLKCANLDPRKLPAKRSLENNCNLKLSNEKYLQGTCQNKRLNFNLENCVGNHNGEFDHGRHFKRTCYFCSMKKENGRYVLTCDCEDHRQSRRREYDALNNFLKFDERTKILRCFDPSKEKDQEDKKPNNKDFKPQVISAKKHKDETIKVNAGKVYNKDIIIPTSDVKIHKKETETTHVIVNESKQNTINIPIHEAEEPQKEEEKDSGAIIDYQKELTGSDNFQRNCRNFKYGDQIFQATCGSNKIELELDLNKCIANVNGNLKFAKDGNYGKSCKECYVHSNGWGVEFLICKCADANKQMKESILSLQEKIIIKEETKQLGCLADLVLENEKNEMQCEENSFLKNKAKDQ